MVASLNKHLQCKQEGFDLVPQELILKKEKKKKENQQLGVVPHKHALVITALERLGGQKPEDPWNLPASQPKLVSSRSRRGQVLKNGVNSI